jgi:hypothetical protein
VRRMTLLFLTLLCAGTLAAFGAENTWTGKISDDMCGASHKAMEHAGKKVDDRECTLACVKGGSKYVFVTEGKVYAIENQSFAALKEHAGHTVKLTGEMSPDKKTIKVSKIEMPEKKKPAA